jgi:hypothetical protein
LLSTGQLNLLRIEVQSDTELFTGLKQTWHSGRTIIDVDGFKGIGTPPYQIPHPLKVIPHALLPHNFPKPEIVWQFQ